MKRNNDLIYIKHKKAKKPEEIRSTVEVEQVEWLEYWFLKKLTNKISKIPIFISKIPILITSGVSQ